MKKKTVSPPTLLSGVLTLFLAAASTTFAANTDDAERAWANAQNDYYSKIKALKNPSADTTNTLKEQILAPRQRDLDQAYSDAAKNAARPDNTPNHPVKETKIDFKDKMPTSIKEGVDPKAGVKKKSADAGTDTKSKLGSKDKKNGAKSAQGEPGKGKEPEIKSGKSGTAGGKPELVLDGSKIKKEISLGHGKPADEPAEEKPNPSDKGASEIQFK